MTHEEKNKRREQVKADVAAGMSERDVAAKHGITMQYVRIVAGLERATPSARVLSVIAKLQSGLATNDIAHDLEITPQAVNAIRRRAAVAGIAFPEAA